MKKMYNSDNVTKTLLYIQKRYKTVHNKTYSIQQIISAFNMLPGKYQDLLLKINKNENDKADLVKVFTVYQTNLQKSKNAPKDIKINIKNIDKEEETKKEVISMEDVETGGDRWIKNVKKNNKPVIEGKKEEEIKETEEEKKAKERVMKDFILKEYIEERKDLNIEEIMHSLNLPEEDYYILMVKFEQNSVKTNSDLSKELGISSKYIDEVVDRFYDKAIEEKKKIIYTLSKEII